MGSTHHRTRIVGSTHHRFISIDSRYYYKSLESTSYTLESTSKAIALYPKALNHDQAEEHIVVWPFDTLQWRGAGPM